MKNKFFTISIFFFFIIVLIRYIIDIRLAALDCDGWMTADWLINFQAGFVRRGLSGEIILWLADLLTLKPNIVVLWITALFHITYMIMLFLLVYRKEVNIWFVVFLLSPPILLFAIYDPETSGKKEIILFFIFSIFIWLLEKKKLKSFFSNFLFSIFIMLGMMCHELIFFYTPYFVIAAYLKSKIDGTPFHLSKIVFLVLGPSLVLITLYLFGKTLNTTEICSVLLEKGLSENICSGILAWPQDFSIKDIIAYEINARYHYNYGICLLLGIAPFACFIKSLKSPLATLKRFFIVFLLLFLFSFPLFILAIDWGRWLNIHFMLLLLISTLLLKDNPSTSKFHYMKISFLIPDIWNSKKFFSKHLNNIVFMVIILSYLSLWSMQCFGNFSILSLNFFTFTDRCLTILGLIVNKLYGFLSVI